MALGRPKACGARARGRAGEVSPSPACDERRAAARATHRVHQQRNGQCPEQYEHRERDDDERALRVRGAAPQRPEQALTSGHVGLLGRVQRLQRRVAEHALQLDHVRELHVKVEQLADALLDRPLVRAEAQRDVEQAAHVASGHGRGRDGRAHRHVDHPNPGVLQDRP